jgi:hypothetical protein
MEWYLNPNSYHCLLFVENLNKAEAKRLVCRRLATILAYEPDDWLWSDKDRLKLSDADIVRIVDARWELMRELNRRGQRR